MKKFRSKLVVAAAAMAVAGIAGGAFAVAQDGGKNDDPARPSVAGPAAINTSLVPEQKFIPVTPCRLLDTRSAGGKIAAGAVRAFDVFGTDLSGQGGSASGCGIPNYAEAIDVNITAVDPDGTGFLRGAAQNTYLFINPDPGTSSVLPNATLVNYSTALNATNATSLPVCNETFLIVQCSGNKEIRFGAFTKATHVVADVVGYFVAPVFATADGEGGTATIYRSSMIDSITRNGVGHYEIDPSRDIRGCAIVAVSGTSDDLQVPVHDAIASVEAFGADDIRVYLTDSTGAAVDGEFTFYAAC